MGMREVTPSAAFPLIATAGETLGQIDYIIAR